MFETDADLIPSIVKWLTARFASWQAQKAALLRATLPASPRLTSKRQCLDTAGSALTGRHPPAAREASHLSRLEFGALHLLSAWFQRVTGGS